MTAEHKPAPQAPEYGDWIVWTKAPDVENNPLSQRRETKAHNPSRTNPRETECGRDIPTDAWAGMRRAGFLDAPCLTCQRKTPVDDRMPCVYVLQLAVHPRIGHAGFDPTKLGDVSAVEAIAALHDALAWCPEDGAHLRVSVVRDTVGGGV